MGKRENFHIPEFGNNIYFFSPEDDVKEVQKTLDDIYAIQEANHFGQERHAIYFLPGVYDKSLEANVGFFMHVAGLGISPEDVKFPSVQCRANWLESGSNHNATCNFWRGVENMMLSSETVFAVSQATYMRRMHIADTMHLHDQYGWASGGFLSDSKVDGIVDSGTQQQWLSRNCDWAGWNGQNWNIVFAGIEEGKAPAETWPEKTYTTVDMVENIQEKPFLVYDKEKGFGVYLPAIRTNCRGVSWDGKAVGSMGKVIPMEEFYIARADVDTADSLNQALKKGKHLFFAPGIYHLDKELVVDQDNKIVLGTGLATLVPDKGNRCIRVTGAATTIAGLLFDAGAQLSDTLLQLEKTNKADYSYLSDLFFRVGGVADYEAKVHSCIVIHRDYVVGDNFWVWRADHGEHVAWDKNTAENGIIVNGDYVTIYALMVEHFEEYQTVWNGEHGKTIMYQSELPYDVPSQEKWMSHDGQMNGYASYYVASNVKTHEAWGLGIYSVFWKAAVDEHCVMEVPETPEVKVHNICAVKIAGHPGLSHVINDEGESCIENNERHIITEWPIG